MFLFYSGYVRGKFWASIYLNLPLLLITPMRPSLHLLNLRLRSLKSHSAYLLFGKVECSFEVGEELLFSQPAGAKVLDGFSSGGRVAVLPAPLVLEARLVNWASVKS